MFVKKRSRRRTRSTPRKSLSLRGRDLGLAAEAPALLFLAFICAPPERRRLLWFSHLILLARCGIRVPASGLGAPKLPNPGHHGKQRLAVVSGCSSQDLRNNHAPLLRRSNTNGNPRQVRATPEA